MTVLDASAVLAFVYDEPGAEVVERAMHEPCRVAAPNWSEVVQKIATLGGDWQTVGVLLGEYGVFVESSTQADAENAAIRWRPGQGLSLADRLCLATAERFDTTVLTADRAWGEAHPVVQIR